MPEDLAAYGRNLRVGQAMHGVKTRMIRDSSVRSTQSEQKFERDPRAGSSQDFHDSALTPSPLVTSAPERHPYSSQIFVPSGTTRWLVLVWTDRSTAHPDGSPHAFLASPDDGVRYHPGYGHHGFVALERTGWSASMMGRMPQDDNSVLANLPAPMSVRLTA